jgi:hypothetical protein
LRLGRNDMAGTASIRKTRRKTEVRGLEVAVMTEWFAAVPGIIFMATSVLPTALAAAGVRNYGLGFRVARTLNH